MSPMLCSKCGHQSEHHITGLCSECRFAIYRGGVEEREKRMLKWAAEQVRQFADACEYWADEQRAYELADEIEKGPDNEAD